MTLRLSKRGTGQDNKLEGPGSLIYGLCGVLRARGGDDSAKSPVAKLGSCLDAEIDGVQSWEQVIGGSFFLLAVAVNCYL